jgi:hypothetical protein
MRIMLVLGSALALVLAAVGCSQKGFNTRLNVESNPAPGVDFSQYKTWNFGRQGEYVRTGIAALDDPAFRQSVADHTIAEMAKLGYTHAVTQPDLLIMFHVAVEDRYDDVKVNPAYQDFDMNWAHASSDDTWQEGSLFLFVIDAKTSSQVWSATAMAELEKEVDLDTRRQRFKETITRMLADFPKRPQ